MKLALSKKEMRLCYARDNGTCTVCGSKKNICFDRVEVITKDDVCAVDKIRLMCEKCILTKRRLNGF